MSAMSKVLLVADFPTPRCLSHFIKANAGVAEKRSNVRYTYDHKGLVIWALLTSIVPIPGDMKRPSCSLCDRIEAECEYPTARKINRGRRKSSAATSRNSM